MVVESKTSSNFLKDLKTDNKHTIKVVYGKAIDGIFFTALSSEVFFGIFIFFIVLLGIRCGIYKSSYNIANISYLNLSPVQFWEYHNTQLQTIL
jgi:hypothetical protein